MDENVGILKTTITICDKHALRIKKALEKIKPLNIEKFINLSDTEIDIIDVLTSRFSKLQDTIERKIFPYYLSLQKENIERKTFIDILNLLEKKEIIPSVDFWDSLREVRNELTHEYPDNPELMVKGLNNCIEKSRLLIDYWEKLKHRIETDIE